MELSTFAGAAIAAMIATSLPAHAQNQYSHHSAPQVIQASYCNHGRVPVKRVIHKLRYKGFYDFHGVRKYNHTYKIKARGPRGKLVRITVNTWSGRIIEIRPVQNHYRYGGKDYGKGYGWKDGYGGKHGGVSFSVWHY